MTKEEFMRECEEIYLNNQSSIDGGNVNYLCISVILFNTENTKNKNELNIKSAHAILSGDIPTMYSLYKYKIFNKDTRDNIMKELTENPNKLNMIRNFLRDEEAFNKLLNDLEKWKQMKQHNKTLLN